MISCGEPSGDLYAGELAREIRAAEPSATISGFGGDRLRAAGANLLGDFSGLSVTGLLEVARILPRTYQIYRRLVAHARAERPDVFVAVDFPDFNFTLARALRKLRIPIVYYISPQLWAWRPGRMKTMRQITDLVLVIFEFEERIYRDAGVPVEWVGHPLLDVMPPARPKPALRAEMGAAPDQPLVALLPGSRRNEVREILPNLVAAAEQIRSRIPAARFVVARAPHVGDDLLLPLARLSGPAAAVLEDRADDILEAADIALVASGTVTVQAALHQCPMVVVYRLSPVTYRLGRPFVQVNTFAMANLVAGRRVVPELMQDEFVPERVAEEALKVLTDPASACARSRRSAERCARVSASRARAVARRTPCSGWLAAGHGGAAAVR